MSYILDALRKSQQARQGGSVPGPRGVVHNISAPLPGGGWWLAVGVVLLMGVLAAAFLFWRSTVNAVPASEPEPAPVETAATDAPSPDTAEKAAAPAETPARNAEVVVQALAEQAQVPVFAARKRKESISRPRSKANPVSAARHALPALPLPTDDTPLLSQMSLDFQRTLPFMAVTIHVYSHDPSQRILFINNREYRQGDPIEGDIRVEVIVPDGAVLSYRGERFKLSRPR